jgi:large subunit ribosomal protein L13
MKTFIAKPAEVEHSWYIVDAEGQTLGRLASQIAAVLRGKHKPIFTPHVDCGDYVIVINAEKIHVTGQRLQQKKYYRHSGYPGGLSEISLADQLERFPTRPVELAVKGMLPKNKLGRKMFKKLKVYAGPEHDYAAQQPVPIELNSREF